VRYHDDPCPSADAATEELSLPLSDEISIVFRKVRVPGSEYWFNARRQKDFGDPDADDIFELRSRLQIFGSFPENNGWYFLLGKYELTKAQAAIALDPDGDLRKGLQTLAKLSADEEDDKLAEIANSGGALLDDDRIRRDLLALPVRYLDWFAVQRVLGALNERCFAYKPCASKLPFADPKQQEAAQPRPDAARAFMRLPTEIEWEYAARGGLALIDEPGFADIRPFPEAEAEDYAHFNATTVARIGRHKPVPGNLYGMYGNVKELTADTFRTGLVEGRPGARTARGASFAETQPSDIRASRREEVPLYSFEVEFGVLKATPMRPRAIGFRLALGSDSVDGPDHRRQLQTSYDTENPARRVTAPGSTGTAPQPALTGSQISRVPPAARVSEPLSVMHRIAKDAPMSDAERTELRDAIEQVASLVGAQLAEQRVARTDVALIAMVEYGNFTLRRLGLKKAIASMKALQQRGALSAQLQVALAQRARDLVSMRNQAHLTAVRAFKAMDQLQQMAVDDPEATRRAIEDVPVLSGSDGALKRIAKQIALDHLDRQFGLDDIIRRLNDDYEDCDKTESDPTLCD